MIVCALAALSLGACASDATFARRLTAEQISQVGAVPVSVSDNTFGITPTWPQRNSTAGAVIPASVAGGVGAVLAIGIDAWANAEPQRRANQTADEFEVILTTETLNNGLAQSFRDLSTTPSGSAVTISDVSRVLRIMTPNPRNNAIEIGVLYQASDYSNVLRIIALATYRDASGVEVYKNLFVYYSPELTAPEYSTDVMTDLVGLVNTRALRPTGEYPTSGTVAGVDYIRDSRDARDDFLTRAEKGILVTDLWTRNDGALLRAEIANAQALIARYVLLDINRPADPAAVPGDEIIETLADGRTVHRIQTGFMAGTYEFQPAGPASRAVFSNGLGLSRTQYNFHRWYAENPPVPAS